MCTHVVLFLLNKLKKTLRDTVISQNSAGEIKGKQKDVILTVYLRA